MKRQRKQTADRTDAYERVTTTIVEALERGTAPWVRPWSVESVKLGFWPRNGHSDHRYRGINTMLAWGTMQSLGTNDPRFYTFNQCKNYGGSHIRKGERGTPIVKWLFFDREQTDDNGNVVLDKDGNPVIRRIPTPRFYTVFNHVQVEWEAGREPGADAEPAQPFDPAAGFERAADLIGRTGADVRHGGGRAYYSPSGDYIRLPKAETFCDLASYWGTALHELTHWTGHEARCARAFGARFGDDAYAFEELVAELGAAFLCADCEVGGRLQHPEYIASWIKVLKGDKHAVFTAARLATEAAGFVHGFEAARAAA